MNLGNLNILYWVEKLSGLCPRGQYSPYYTKQQTDLPFALERNTFSQGCSLHSLEKSN